MSNKRFSEEFKIEAVQQITEQRYPMTEGTRAEMFVSNKLTSLIWRACPLSHALHGLTIC